MKKIIIISFTSIIMFSCAVNKPDDSNPVAYFIQDGAGPPGQLKLEILGTNDTNFTLLYYMQPELVSQSTDSTNNLTDNIHEMYHREVIKLAARAILANIESPQYSTMRSEIAEQQQ